LSKKFNKGIGFAICATIFSQICILILGFSKWEYDSSVIVSENGILDGLNKNTKNDTTNYSNENNSLYCSECGNILVTDAKFCTRCGKKI
jgi:hypothetical protein